ncbi:SMC-Scp complex subunit ScpB [Sporomusa sp. KB1]|jgi:segregation and condensation protein B|uniref:SMC-Scp complex subunit ScpB n=1 Tax=Sporomusa sp. KB1 TaxID=943346 RepID=UPI0011A47AB8|nr:SMC-Scp complex subunit ScpB [Sporomusa sp. KB1]TWH48981.1 segregation and condensation protein B [Sporomusa sp. KB1]
MSNRHLWGAIEALLFASGQPLPPEKIAGILNISIEEVHTLTNDMATSMADEKRGLTIVEVAGGYQLCTKPIWFSIVSKLAEIQDSRLSAAALETLAIVAFKQPVTRQEIEGIRGVNADRVIATLLDRFLIKEIGRKEAVGRPILYGTTNEFLQCFGLKSLDDLPAIASLVPVAPEQ